MSKVSHGRKPSTRRRVVSDPKPSAPAPASAAHDGGSEPTRHSPCAAPSDTRQPDLSGIADIIVEALRDNLSFFHPLRRRICEIEGNYDGNGEGVGPPRSRDADNLIVRLFREADTETQRIALSGWNPNLLDSDYAAMRDELNCPHDPAIGVASKSAYRGKPFTYLTAIENSTIPARVIIRVGSLKRDVLQCLRELAQQIDTCWDDLIQGPAHDDKGGER